MSTHRYTGCIICNTGWCAFVAQRLESMVHLGAHFKQTDIWWKNIATRIWVNAFSVMRFLCVAQFHSHIHCILLLITYNTNSRSLSFPKWEEMVHFLATSYFISLYLVVLVNLIYRQYINLSWLYEIPGAYM